MPDSRPAGRPIEFLPDEALDAAMQLFWERGYEATSLQDLESRTGLARSSLYNSFGSKRDLYAMSLARYKQQLGELMFAPLENGTAGLEDIDAFLDRLAAGLGRLLGAPNAAGCLMINSMMELGGKDREFAAMSQELFGRLRAAMTATLRRAVARGEASPDGLDGRVRLLLALALGINVKSRSGATREEIGELVHAAHELVRSWRIPKARRMSATRR